MRTRKRNRKKENKGVRLIRKRIRERLPEIHRFVRRCRILAAAGLKETVAYLKEHHHPTLKSSKGLRVASL
jgi:hypothetical protein